LPPELEYRINTLYHEGHKTVQGLKLLVGAGFLKKRKIGASNFYINEPLYQLFKDNKMSRQKAEPIKTVNQANE